MKPGERKELVAVAARTASGNSGMIQGFGDTDELTVQLDVDAVSGTTPSLTLTVESSIDGGTNWNVQDTFPAVTAAGVTVRTITNLIGDVVRVAWAISGTTPSFTFGVNAFADTT